MEFKKRSMAEEESRIKERIRELKAAETAARNADIDCRVPQNAKG